MTTNAKTVLKATGLTIIIGIAAFGGGLAGGALYASRAAGAAADAAAAADADGADALQVVRSDPGACSRSLPAAADLCTALARYDKATTSIAAWAEPNDRAPITAILSNVRDGALKSRSPSWVKPMDWAEEAILRRTSTLEAALSELSKKDGEAKSTISPKLPDILGKALLMDTNTP